MVLTTPTRQSCLRALTTETAGTTTATLDPPSVARPAMDKEASPSLYVANRPNSFGGKVDSAPDTVAEEFRDRLKIRDRFGDQGSVVEQRYRPGDLLRDPPAPKDVTLELLMASQTHMGHHRSQWNPANARYVYGVRAGIHIISLEQTAAHLRRAARVVEEVAYRGGLLLFVGTRKGQMETVVRAAALAGACHVFTKWNPGAITNHDVLLANSALRIVDEHDQALPGFDEHLRDRRPLRPDLVIVLNPLENFALLHECGLVDIPTIAVLDTDADPTRITYPIPANDDRYVFFFLLADPRRGSL